MPFGHMSEDLARGTILSRFAFGASDSPHESAGSHPGSVFDAAFVSFPHKPGLLKS